ncbi:MAG: tyrosine-type recombinase/integrase [Planctomycetota bacterium]|nr:tyrosine-type recombinase/integrase [Planctomycetota bacterium]
MASISKQANGRKTVQFVGADGKRRSIRLGKISVRDAEKFKGRLENLVTASITGHAIDGDTARWIAELDQVMLDRLSSVGLIQGQGRRSLTFAEWIGEYINARTDLAGRTVNNLQQAEGYIVGFLGKTKLLRDVSPGDGDELWRWMLTQLGENTVRRHMGRAKQFTRAAYRKRLIATDPFDDIKGCSVQADESRLFFVTREMADKVTDACPDVEWRLLFALVRFGGLRCPSECLTLTWDCVDWTKNRLQVQSPKTGLRTIPLFPEIRIHLEAAFDQAAEGAQFVITRYRSTNTNLRTQLNRIIKRAGLTPWKKPFQNCRSTRETELVERFPIHVVTSWLGNSPRIAMKHYLQTTDAHFDDACKPDKATSGALQNPVQYAAASDRDEPCDNQPTIRIQPETKPCGPILDRRYPRQDSNL